MASVPSTPGSFLSVSLSGGDVNTCMPMSVEPSSGGAYPTTMPSVDETKASPLTLPL